MFSRSGLFIGVETHKKRCHGFTDLASADERSTLNKDVSSKIAAHIN